ncbi:MAG: type II secretion system protein GspG, partial [Planctomycetota bacterium]
HRSGDRCHQRHGNKAVAADFRTGAGCGVVGRVGFCRNSADSAGVKLVGQQILGPTGGVGVPLHDDDRWRLNHSAHTHRHDEEDLPMPVLKTKTAAARRGFSLLEIMLVLAVMGALMAVVAVSIGGFGERGKIRATEASMNTLKTALDAYHLEYSAYPPTLATLQTVRPPLVDANQNFMDGWNMPLQYVPGPTDNGEKFQLISFGGVEEYDPEKALSVWTIGNRN